MRTVAVVDSGLSNLDSVVRAVEECGGVPQVTDDAKVLRAASRVIFPGVGSFADAMARLRQRGLDDALREIAMEREVPLLGICLGMQLMASIGREGGDTPGLGLIDGEVRRLEPDDPHTRVPHVGWNEVSLVKESVLFRCLTSGKDFYFVHSYHLVARRDEDVVGRTPYCGGFVSAVQRGSHVFGVQFHPEKSQKAGFHLLRNFISL